MTQDLLVVEDPQVAEPPDHSASSRPAPQHTDRALGPWRTPVLAVGVLLLVAGVGLRFATRSPLWLDEVLSVNISKLPLGQIPEALRHDGHPPLYYFLLHGWMTVFGEGDVAVRALSGLFGVVVVPLMFVAGRRIGGERVAWIVAALTVISPFAIRYSTETRMYSLVMVLVVGGWLVGEDALRRPTAARLVGIALITAMLLLSHYWSLWLLAAVGAGLLVRLRRAHRQGRADERACTLKVLAAMGVGALFFVPWLPSLLYQGRHTGTPWARPVRPPDLITTSLADFGGGPQGEAICFGWFLAIFALIGVFGRRVDDRRIELDLTTRPESRRLALLVVMTISIASAAGYATDSTYATRYAAVFFPFFILLAALGISRLGSRPVLFGSMAVLLGLATAGVVRTAASDRSQAAISAQKIQAHASRGDYVAYCPDQLGPAVARILGQGYRQVTYPRFGAPQRVDWVDYVTRLEQHSPRRFASELLRRAGDHRIFLVWNGEYFTHAKACTNLVNALLRGRPTVHILSESKGGKFYEKESVYEYPAPATPPAG